MTQQELAQQYQKQLDQLNNNEFFEDAKKCDICSSPNVHFEERTNCVSRICLECYEYSKRNEQ